MVLAPMSPRVTPVGTGSYLAGTFGLGFDQERMRSLLAADDVEVCHDHRFTRGQTLRDQFLRAVVGRVRQEEQQHIRDPPADDLNPWPELAAASFSVSAKHPSSPFRCISSSVLGVRTSELEHGPGRSCTGP